VVKMSFFQILSQPKNVVFLFWFLLLGCFTQNLIAAPLASIDRNVIAKDDTLGFTIRSYKNNSSAPDLSPLENNFYVVANNQSSRFVNRNGQSESWTEWKISLIPKRVGQLTIPPIRVNGEITTALYVNVQPSIPVSAGEMKPVYIESEVDNDVVYVQQQLIYTLRIFQSIQLENMNISEPEFDNAAMEKMEQNSFQRRIRNTPYRVHELRYAIFPQETGEFIIPEMVFSANQVEAKRSVFAPPGQGKTIRKISKQHTITVKAPPTEYGPGLWLPAEAITLKQSWSNSLDDIHVGDSITRSVTLNAEGLLKSQLPPFQFPRIATANTYPDQGQSESNTSNTGVKSNRTDSTAIIPTQAGILTLPEIRIKWWNTKENTIEETIIPESSFVVKEAKENMQGNSKPLAVDHSRSDLADGTELDVAKNNSLIWQLSTLFFAVAWVLTLLIWRNSTTTKQPTQQNLNDPKRSNLSEKDAFKALEDTCKDNDLTTIRRAVILWGQCYWPDKNIQTLQDISKHCGSMHLKESFLDLDTQLYGNSENSSWTGDQLLTSLKELRKNSEKRPSKSDQNLQPLYPS